MNGPVAVGLGAATVDVGRTEGTMLLTTAELTTADEDATDVEDDTAGAVAVSLAKKRAQMQEARLIILVFEELGQPYENSSRKMSPLYVEGPERRPAKLLLVRGNHPLEPT